MIQNYFSGTPDNMARIEPVRRPRNQPRQRVSSLLTAGHCLSRGLGGSMALKATALADNMVNAPRLYIKVGI
jgi:hypothetical protein